MGRAPTTKRKTGGRREATVATYLAALPVRARTRLRQVRRVIHAAAPGALECISYRVPALSLDGRPFVWYAAWRHHVSLYPVPAGMRGRAEIAAYEKSKGTLRFPLTQPLPVALVRKVVKALIAQRRRSKG